MTSDLMKDRTGKEYPVQEIFASATEDYLAHHEVSDEQRKVVSCISCCKTGELGYNISFCDTCGFTEIRPNSCNNRHCPCCQAPLEQKWVQARDSELIKGIAYYHAIFTVPYELNDLIYDNQKELYSLLFRCTSDTLLTLCRDRKYLGATPGLVMVLHTWGQKLNFHPHIHTMLSGGGLKPDGKFVEAAHKGYLLPKEVMGRLFRGKFLDGLKKLHDAGKLDLKGRCSALRNSYGWREFIDRLYKKPWIPHIKETFNGNGNAVKYLARYAYRTAIANSRIVSVSAEKVSFRYKDYADGSKAKTLTVTSEEFVGLFLQHVLPKGFCRIRFAGFLANSCKTEKLKLICRLRNTVFRENPVRGKNTAYLLKLIYGTDICTCPNCRSALRFLRASPGIGKEDLLDFCFRSSKTV